MKSNSLWFVIVFVFFITAVYSVAVKYIFSNSFPDLSQWSGLKMEESCQTLSV